MKLATLDGTDHNIAMGVSAGIFISFSPTIPFHTILGIICAVIMGGSKRAAVISVWISNPLTIPLFYAAAYYTGVALLGTHHADIQFIYDLIDIIEGDMNTSQKLDHIIMVMKPEMQIFYAMLFGGAVLGIPASIASYFLTRKWVKQVRNEKVPNKK
jgi:uncharacterized protein (DUF2062 family)